MEYGRLSAMEIFYSPDHVIYLEWNTSEMGRIKVASSYQRDSFRNFPIRRSDEVSQVALFFPGKDQPDPIT